jgi:CRP/FNR family transcriptional regulator, cyclic AMP receptor protein
MERIREEAFMLVTRLFEHASDVRNVAAGTTIFREGDERDYMYAVVDGEVDLSVAGQPLDTVAVGGLFGEMALIDKAPRIATAVARTNAKIVPVDEKRFLFLIQQTPNFAIHVMRVLSERLRRMDERFAASSS